MRAACSFYGRDGAGYSRQHAAAQTVSSTHHGRNKRDLLDVRDAVCAYELLLRAGERGRVYPITSGKLRTIGELADRFDMLAKAPLSWEVGQSQAVSPVLDPPEAMRDSLAAADYDRAVAF